MNIYIFGRPHTILVLDEFWVDGGDIDRSPQLSIVHGGYLPFGWHLFLAVFSEFIPWKMGSADMSRAAWWMQESLFMCLTSWFLGVGKYGPTPNPPRACLGARLIQISDVLEHAILTETASCMGILCRYKENGSKLPLLSESKNRAFLLQESEERSMPRISKGGVVSWGLLLILKPWCIWLQFWGSRKLLWMHKKKLRARYWFLIERLWVNCWRAYCLNS